MSLPSADSRTGCQFSKMFFEQLSVMGPDVLHNALNISQSRL